MQDDLLSFAEAVARLQAYPEAHSFAVLPIQRGAEVVGGTVFTLSSYDDDDDEYISMSAEGGLFGDSCGFEDTHDLESFDADLAQIKQQYGLDPRELRYKACTPEQMGMATGMQTEFAVAALNGYPDGEVPGRSTIIKLIEQHLSA
ncbi:hypothetical protein [Vogesella sp. XCS3]|uniref:hypothetical protein n=1 Tax=Vogesella sp. XCS3 TaxID=2877939 RepID=UPI001D0ABE97|nr:hypothetical protein [Vogesella sp. XCS3]UDM18862.1 hypothetical protein LCH97_18505 [Vogesella sp. XCS3]